MAHFEGLRHFTLREFFLYGLAVVVVCGIVYVAASDARARNAAEGRALARNTALIVHNQELIHEIQVEGEQRRDQTCALFENAHLNDVKQLRGTYRYLVHLPRNEWGTSLTKAIVVSLPQTEAKARRDDAPAYCDEPGAKAEARGAKPVGLPEPDPALPKRRNFQYLLRR